MHCIYTVERTLVSPGAHSAEFWERSLTMPSRCTICYALARCIGKLEVPMLMTKVEIRIIIDSCGIINIP